MGGSKFLLPCFLLIVFLGCDGSELKVSRGDVMDDRREMSEAREMVKRQIEARGVHNSRVLDVMRRVPRREFVPTLYKSLAYEDRPLPIGENQTISQPYVVAYMTELLDLGGDERVLELGSGSGYQAAVLSLLAREVYSIEIIPTLAKRAEETLRRLGYSNVLVKRADGFDGWEEQAPFDRIIITFAVSEIPPPLIQQLAEGGILVAPEGGWFQEIVVLRKKKGKLKKERKIPVRFVPMLRE